jgi:class 3 adenylate cyclase/CHASE2 domain-containing sensor protein
MARGLSARTRSLVSGAAVGVAVGMIAAVTAAVRPALLERAEHASYDIRAQAVMDPSAASKHIVLIDIGETDIEDVENNFDLIWPWPRSLYGEIATYCKKAGARAIVFDWLFQDRGVGVSDDEQFADALRAAGNAVIGLALTRNPVVERPLEGPWAARLGTFRDPAEARAIALRLSAWNVRAFRIGDELWYGGKKSADDVIRIWNRLVGLDEMKPLLVPDESAEPVPPTPSELAAEQLAGEMSITALIRDRDGVAIAGSFPQRDGLDPPLAIIAAAPARMGNVYQMPEADGIIRRHAPLVRHGDRGYPSLALAAYLVGHPGVVPRLDGRTLALGDRSVELDSDGGYTIRFHGRAVYPHLRAYEVLRSSVLVEEDKPPSVPFEALRDKYVIVTAAGQALRDLRATPVSIHHLGAEIQANALDNLLAGAFVSRAPRVVDAAITFVVCIVVSFLMLALWRAIGKPTLALAATAAVTLLILFAYYMIARTALDHANLWLAVAAPAIGGIVAGFGTLLGLSAVERRNKRFVQEALGRYTSTALVRELMEHPEHLSLEWGDRREMSVYFSDIAGFTTISEGLPPEDLVALLNDYLTSMTDLVLAHGGVVDKYIGDAVMAFWGAPLPDPKHARNAVLCALAMRRRCDELRAGWKQRYGHDVFARAGVNSGDAVVGNMGSKHKYNYTVMGDMVNLASRLEGANKAYGTFLMISQTTVDRLGDAVDVRELDLIAVKGKDRPVTVYEVVDVKGPTASRATATATSRARWRSSRRWATTGRRRRISNAASSSSNSRRRPTGTACGG